MNFRAKAHFLTSIQLVGSICFFLTLFSCASTQEISMSSEELFRFNVSTMNISTVILKSGEKVSFRENSGHLVKNSRDSTQFIIAGYNTNKRKPEYIQVPFEQIQTVEGERVDGRIMLTIGLFVGISIAAWAWLISSLAGMHM